MWAKLSKQWFLIGIAICFAIGFFASGALRPVAEIPYLRSGIVFLVMWAMGVTLRADAVRRSIARPLPALLAIGINLVLVPLLALPAAELLPQALFGGLFIATLVPCTLASASVWTRRAGGDDSVAMMTTVVTNLACVLVVPIGLALVLARQGEISALDQVYKLAIVVVAPLVLAQVMRRLGAGGWADRHKSRLSLLGQWGILLMVVFGAMASAETIRGEPTESPLGWMLAAGLLLTVATIHTVALAIGVLSARALGISRDKQIAVGIAGSQKTLMVGLQIAIDCGLSVIPMLVYHISQLFIDTLIVDRWKRGSEDTIP